MSSALLSSRQREILEALADHWVLQRWRLRDGSQRWHMGEDEVDGRSVAGLRRRRLIAWDDYVDRLVLTDAGRRAVRESPSAAPGAPESGRVALGATNTASGAPDAPVDDQGASPARDAAREEW
jgi:hypothetical protein